GTATGGGVDYTGTPSNLTFTGTANETQTITVPIVDDNIVEGNETFTVQLGTPTNGVTLAKGSATGTITNDDTGVAIQTAGVTHPEGDSGPTAFAFSVTRTGNLSGSTNVAYAVTGSGANPADGADFAGGTLPANSVNFAAGSATATITINVNGDLIVEPDETFTVTLSNPNNGASLGNATAIGTITNDDSCAAGTTAPVLDNSVPTAYCDTINRDLDDYTNSPIPPNSELLWSTNSDPLVVADHLVGSIATTAGSYYGFFYDSLNDCASATLQVTLTLNTSPFAGSDVNAFACNSTDTGGSTTLDLDEQLTGEDPGGTWTITTDPSGGMTIGAGNVVDFSGLAVNSVYVFTYTTNNAVAPCVNDTAAVTVTVTDCTCPAGNVAPVLDTSVPTAFCDVVSQDLNEYTQSVAPTGTTLTWSTNSDPTVANAHIFSDVDAPGTYYGFFYDADDNCGSPVLTVNLTINTTPEVLTTIPGSRCGIGTVTLGGTRDPGAVLNWYDSETGGTFLGTGTSFVTPSIDTTTTFYVEATANGCTSERTAVIATVYEQPIAGIANNTTACSLVDGFTTVDLNSRLVGADPGVWSITTVPTGATVAIGPGDVVDFAAQPDGDYIFTYTTNTAQAPCTDASTTLTVSVSPLDCGPDDIDLELVKEVDMGTVDVGGQVVFTLTLTNLSDVEVTNIVVSDPIGIGFGFAFVTSTPVGAYDNLTGEWTIDTLEPLGMRTLQIIASVPVEGTFTNTASITASFPNDGNPLNNESSVNVEVLPTVCLRIFNQISPNGDGINDELIINCIRNYKNNKLEIFDRYGNKVFSKTNYDNTWSGTGKNGDLPKGTYFYSLDLGDGSAARTGWIQIIR
ncbi:gliding motility-associated C-terminal domain-containing protein, partial [Flavobacteriaceae bacterium F89]